MTASKKAASEKGAAARSEANGKAPTEVKFKGLALTMPRTVPFKLLKDITGFGTDQEPPPKVIVDVLETILGPEQSTKVWDAGLDMEEGGELFKQVLEAMGLTLGESPASETSSGSAGTS